MNCKHLFLESAVSNTTLTPVMTFTLQLKQKKHIVLKTRETSNEISMKKERAVGLTEANVPDGGK